MVTFVGAPSASNRPWRSPASRVKVAGVGPTGLAGRVKNETQTFPSGSKIDTETLLPQSDPRRATARFGLRSVAGGGLGFAFMASNLVIAIKDAVGSVALC
jgi:hypothetical protein